MKKLISSLILAVGLLFSVSAKQYVESIKINRVIDLGFLTYTTDGDKCVRVIQSYIDKGYRIISASYDYEQGGLILVYEDNK